MTSVLRQSTRLWLLAAYSLGLMLISRIATGQWVPPLNQSGLWFYSGVFAFIMGALIEAPTHVVPKQALAFGILASIATVGTAVGTWSVLSVDARWMFTIAVLTLISVIVASVSAILWKDAPIETTRGKAGRSAYNVAGAIGRPEVVTTAPFVFALFAYHAHDTTEVLWLVAGWTALVLVRPLERMLEYAPKVIDIWKPQTSPALVGDIIGHSVPGIVTVRHGGASSIAPGTPLIVRGDDGKPNVALALGYVGYADGRWLRGLQLELDEEDRVLAPTHRIPAGACAVMRDSALLKAIEKKSATMRKRANLVGFVSSSSDTRMLRFELVRHDVEIKEGQLVETQIGGREVLYQILNGITHEDILQQKNTRGYVIGSARKIGSWSEDASRFDHVHWVPAPNTPVYLKRSKHASVPAAVGVFPETEYPVYVNPHELVTHNTAVLGILGVGKTFLALELVERMLNAGVRVICLDLTDQYSRELAPHLDPTLQGRVTEYLQNIGQAGRDNVTQNVEEGGSKNQFEEAVRRLVFRFLDPQQDRRLCVVNPNAFEVWRQDSKPYAGRASMATLTAAEITRIISEAALEGCQNLGMTDTARCCLVYEEAHSLIPEWNAVAAEGDKAASNGTARAILQGRKFGLGCLVVTQRTASVTKTILNQCNTVFALRTFDATGMEFLSNYIGNDYTAVLSALADRHGVAFGRASSCPDPVLVRFNDRDKFVAHARAEGAAVAAGAIDDNAGTPDNEAEPQADGPRPEV